MATRRTDHRSGRRSDTTFIATCIGASLLITWMICAFAPPLASGDAGPETIGDAAVSPAAPPSDAGIPDAEPATALSALPPCTPAAAADAAPATAPAAAPPPAATDAAVQATKAEDTGLGYLDRALAFFRSGAGLPMMIFLLFGIAKLSTKMIPWLSNGANAAYSAAALAFLGTMADAVDRGIAPSLQVMIAGAGSALLLLTRAHLVPAASTTAPAATAASAAAIQPLGSPPGAEVVEAIPPGATPGPSEDPTSGDPS